MDHYTQRKNLIASSKYYDEARKFAQLASKASKKTDYTEYVVVTGGGPGVMEAGSRGTVDVGAPNIGLNIVLPHEQAPNEYVTPEFSFNFHYYAIRKMHFLMRASSVAVFPGGFGTLDEFFETLTLIQTGRMERVPVLLFGKKFWGRVINLEALAEEGTISPDDTDLFTIEFCVFYLDGLCFILLCREFRSSWLKFVSKFLENRIHKRQVLIEKQHL